MMYGNTYRPAYPGFLTQTYPIGAYNYSTGGSEAQRPPSRITYCRMPYQWQREHKDETSFSLAGQGLAMTDRSAARKISGSAATWQKVANERTTAALTAKLNFTGALHSELSTEQAAVAAEQAELAACMAKTQAAFDAKKAPLEAIASWYAKRQKRHYTEKLCDPVKHDLEVFTATLTESCRLLECCLSAQQSEEMRLKVKKAALDADIADKASGISIDTQTRAISMSARPTTAPSPVLSARQDFRMPGMSNLHAPFNPVMWQSSSKTICDEARKVVMVSKRLRETSNQIISKREAAELEVYMDLVRDYAASMAAIKQVITATSEQIAMCEAEMAEIDNQVSSSTTTAVAHDSRAALTTDHTLSATLRSPLASPPTRTSSKRSVSRSSGSACARRGHPASSCRTRRSARSAMSWPS